MLPVFQSEDLYQTALVHRSFLNETDSTESNERLEFLGDAVLELATTQFLYAAYPNANEGVMTSYRAALVKTVTLAQVAKELGLDQELKMSKGEERSGGRENPSLLADTFEAVLGALYLDQGFDVCVTFLQDALFPRFDQILKDETYKDYKTTLQELVQAQGKSTPIYVTVNETGPDHLKTFTVEVRIDGEAIGSGVGKSKQDASQEAAKLALEKLGNN
ncbi:ribonuclease III [Candidatus Woesebacteria bacterium]|nr:ribonuclease III [Candidatus Woesebacteria bacterium]